MRNVCAAVPLRWARVWAASRKSLRSAVPLGAVVELHCRAAAFHSEKLLESVYQTLEGPLNPVLTIESNIAAPSLRTANLLVPPTCKSISRLAATLAVSVTLTFQPTNVTPAAFHVCVSVIG